MTKELIFKYGKDKINTLTKYPSILTLHQLGEKGKLLDGFTTSLEGEKMYATEKIDGTNVRILSFAGEYILGSREFLLHHSNDLFFDPAQGIVEYIRVLNIKPFPTNVLTVFYGELYGGKIHANSKNYGTSIAGFRLFDVAVFEDLSILDEPLPSISRWRERETDSGMIYGQKFISRTQLKTIWEKDFELVPEISFDLGDMSHESIFNNMSLAIPKTQVALTDSALLKPEGLVLRNEDRSKIVKIRFEDYEKTLKNKLKIH